jgi:hypothetical protein
MNYLPLMQRLLFLLALLAPCLANAIERWQKVLVLGNETTDIGQLLKDCEWRATVTASGPANRLTQRLRRKRLRLAATLSMCSEPRTLLQRSR